MSVYALTVGKNEADRYLEPMLHNTADAVDGHFFFDDQSTDDTVAIARRYCTVSERTDDSPSFLEHEGQFRQTAWWAFETYMRVEEGDWVLAIDCDEFLVTNDDPYSAIHTAVRDARRSGQVAVMMPVPEVFGFDGDGTPMVRTDGFWGRIAGTRLFEYRRGGKFSDKPMGCGSEPSYVGSGKHGPAPRGVWLMHYGYARPEDVAAKYERYNALAHGHADSHIQSIPKPPGLSRWDGPWVREAARA